MKAGLTVRYLGKRALARSGRAPGRCLGALTAAAIVRGVVLDGFAQVPQTLNGPPVQVQPYVPEPGVPLITINPGTSNPFSGADGVNTGTQTGADASGSTSDSTSGASGSSGVATGDQTVNQDYSSDGTGSSMSYGGSATTSTALGTMLGTSWGATAVENAQTLGVNSSAVAATCVIESGCQNLSARSGSTVAGAFQMTAGTFTAMIKEAVAENPSLAGQIVPGLAGQMDPSTQAIAAAQYLKDGAHALQAANISNPTVLDVRGFYNFGAKYGAPIAGAQDDTLMSEIVPQSALSANQIPATETVGQWRASVGGKIGNAAGQSVLI
jgi:hypothetical protein